jgi:enterochelin esterase-like enzyme
MVAGDRVAFRLDDPEGVMTGVRLQQEVRIPGDHLDFGFDGMSWLLDLPRPDVDRMEYLFEVRDASGATATMLDPDNPNRVRGAFGEKSVLEFPGYVRPPWLDHPAPEGRRRSLPVATRSLDADVDVVLWSPEGLSDSATVPLVLVHDGPEYDELAGITTYLSAAIASDEIPPVRAALLAPGDRNERYSADLAYTRALCLAVIPQLTAEVPTSVVVGVGASLGALAMLHAQRQSAGCLDGLFLQSGSFFHPRHDAHERRFSRYDRVVRAVDGVLRGGGHPAPVPTVMTCGTLEENLANNRIMARALAAQGYDVTLREVRDVHNYTAWRDAFDPWLTGLLREVVRGSER